MSPSLECIPPPPQPPALCSSVADGLALLERLALFREHGHLVEPALLDLPLGRRWIGKLKAMPPFDTHPHLWEKFLAANRITESELLHALAVPAEFLAAHAGEAGSWAEDLEEALAEYPWSEPPRLPWPEDRGQQARLLTFSMPIIAWALRRIRRGLDELEAGCGEQLVPAEGLENLFLSPLADAAYTISHRALVLELNIARLDETLAGETPGERFDSFVRRLAEPGPVRAWHEEYPVLSRQLVESLCTIADFCLDFLRHFAADRAALEETFRGGAPLGTITGLSMSGDSHRQGRRVLILELEGGRKLLYKPHSLGVDLHFQSLLTWLNERGYPTPFRTLLCLSREDHGWTEFIATADCSTEEEIGRFYRRQGGLLAVLYAMLATDFHHENLIAAGEHPVLVDLESLFHPTLRPYRESQLEEAVRNAMNYSVLRTALLPTVHYVGRNATPFEVGGLSDVEGQETPHAAPYVKMSVEDEAHIDRMRVRMRGSQNVPTLHAVKPDPAAYTEEIVEGFTAMYELLLANREELLAPGGPVQAFAGDSVRFIFRHTRVYAVLARETHHPDLQRHALDRDGHFVRLWALLEEREDVSGLIVSEVRSLWQGDVPFFSTRTDSVDLFDHEHRRHPDLLAQSCLDEVVGHVGRLSPKDRQQQIWFIRGAIACQQIQEGENGAGGRVGRPSFLPAAGSDRPSPAAFLDEACRIGDRLADLALRGTSKEGEGATWLGMVLRQENAWLLMPSGVDLYNGISGIALFLAYLARATGESRYSALARDAVTEIRRQQKTIEHRLRINGAFTGWGGLIYLYTHLYSLWQEPRLLDEALACARAAGEVAGSDRNHELMYGNAGGILALDGLYAIHPAPEVLEAMRRCGDRLLSQAVPMSQGLGWRCAALDCPELGGYSHGAAGIASALEALYRRTGSEPYRQGALAALAFEGSLFLPEHGNWKDMRIKPTDPAAETSFPVVWCNGAPGIGLARLRMPSLLEDPAVATDIEAALETTRRLGFGHTHSLCHGDLGNLELFLEARRVGWPTLAQNEIELYGAGILEGVRQHGWICGTPRGIETPGLMTGLAGIGYGFLRLHDPAGIPSVVVLEPPVSARS